MSIDVRQTRRQHSEGSPTPISASPTSPWLKRTVPLLGVCAAVALGGILLLNSVSKQSSTSLLTHTVTLGDLLVTVTEEGSLESATNKEIKCTVKGGSTILSIIDDGTIVEPGDELVQLDASTIEEEISQ